MPGRNTRPRAGPEWATIRRRISRSAVFSFTWKVTESSRPHTHSQCHTQAVPCTLAPTCTCMCRRCTRTWMRKGMYTRTQTGAQVCGCAGARDMHASITHAGTQEDNGICLTHARTSRRHNSCCASAAKSLRQQHFSFAHDFTRAHT
jgi:hypothetical protein